MHDIYTHTETCTQTFKSHLRTHLAARKKSLGAVSTPQPIPANSNMSSAETLKPVSAPACTCGLPVRGDEERLWSGGDLEKREGPFCECKQRVTVIDRDDGGGGGGKADADAAVAEPKKSLKSKALDLLCSACTGYVAKPKAGGFYPNEE